MFDDYADSKRLYKTYTLQRTDPYGMWIVLDSKGREVQAIAGSFTSPQDAAKALDNYLVHLPKKV